MPAGAKPTVPRPVCATRYPTARLPGNRPDARPLCGGLSRTNLAERFRRVMGATPLSCLRNVRMQKTMAVRGETGRYLEQVAR